jgi:hypothetical protein
MRRSFSEGGPPLIESYGWQAGQKKSLRNAW